MGIIKRYIAYLQNNPEQYWFKRKLFGWGWVPVRWQGWLVIVISVAIIVLGVYIGDADDAPGATLIGVVLAIILILSFSYWKGEKPKWTWGLPKSK